MITKHKREKPSAFMHRMTKIAMADRPWCMIIHDPSHILFIKMYKGKPKLIDMMELIDEIKTDEECNYMWPVEDKNFDLLNCTQAMRILPNDWADLFIEGTAKLGI